MITQLSVDVYIGWRDVTSL